MTSLINTLIFSNCILCDATSGNSSVPLCLACSHDLPYKGHSCHQCGIPLVNKSNFICGKCLTTHSQINTTFSLFHYKPPIDHLLKQLKFHQKLLYAHIMGNMMADAVINNAIPLPDALLPVPLHINRIRGRGFNQALEIAKPIAKKLKIPLITQSLIRSRYTQAQTELSAKERRSNIKNSFQPQLTNHYKHIAVIDDVITTGTTMNEIAKILKQGKVEKVYAWACAQVSANKMV